MAFLRFSRPLPANSGVVCPNYSVVVQYMYTSQFYSFGGMAEPTYFGRVTEGVAAGEAVFRILWTLLTLSAVFPSVSLRHVSTRHHIVMFVCLDKAATDSFEILPSS